MTDQGADPPARKSAPDAADAMFKAMFSQARSSALNPKTLKPYRTGRTGGRPRRPSRTTSNPSTLLCAQDPACVQAVVAPRRTVTSMQVGDTKGRPG
jgi:hypothetical protein